MNNVKSKSISVRDMTFTALFAAVLCVVAPVSIPIGPIPLSLATFIIYLAAGTLGWKYGVISVALYVMIGAVGVPVFSGHQGGFHRIVGVTGGYIVGYIPLALATGIAANMSKKIWVLALGMVVGRLLLYTLGTAWFMLQSGRSLAESLALCVTPFLPGDAGKIVAACIIAPQLRAATKALKR